MLQKWSNSTILKCSELNTLKEQIENYFQTPRIRRAWNCLESMQLKLWIATMLLDEVQK